jgi:hypothetical protein
MYLSKTYMCRGETPSGSSEDGGDQAEMADTTDKEFLDSLEVNFFKWSISHHVILSSFSLFLLLFTYFSGLYSPPLLSRYSLVYQGRVQDENVDTSDDDEEEEEDWREADEKKGKGDHQNV